MATGDKLVTLDGLKAVWDVNQNDLRPMLSEMILPTNYAQLLTNANTAPVGRSYIFSSQITDQMVANLPEYGAFGILITFNSLADRDHGRIQIFGNKNGRLWFRVETGSNANYNYTAWEQVTNRSVFDDLWGGYHYINSPIIKGGLYSDGTIYDTPNRAVFPEYQKLNCGCYLAVESGGYAASLCTYNDSYVFQNRVTVSASSYGYVPPRTFFRVAVFPDPAAEISDPAAYAKKCWLIPTPANVGAPIGSGDNLNNIKDTGIYCAADSVPVNAPIAYDAPNARYGVLTVQRKPNSTAVYQTYIDYRGNYFQRVYTNGGVWQDWQQFARISDVNAMTSPKALPAKIFMRVGCIGDSYTSGYVNNGTITRSNPDFAWPKYMEGITGNTWTNFGASGSTCKSWVLRQEGYSRLDEIEAVGNKCQAYVIGLMINDSNPESPRYAPVGTIADVGTDANSYFAYYYKLIKALNTVNPSAKIFCNTCPRTESRFTEYNQAVRDLVSYCHNTESLPVYLCDLAGASYNNTNYYQNPDFLADALAGHFTAIGYEFMAECYVRVMSDVINTNVSEFQNVHQIDYDQAN